MMRIIDWNPANGDLCQGDVEIFRLPDSVRLNLADEVRPRDRRLILAEGELTGHHHAIWLPQPVMFRDDGLARELAPELAAETQAPAGTARLYRDPSAIRQLIELGELDHERLAIGLLIVEGAPVVLRHDEHDAVRISPGRYYVGGQNEWNAAEERRVAD
jgi:hypothetical protein